MVDWQTAFGDEQRSRGLQVIRHRVGSYTALGSLHVKRTYRPDHVQGPRAVLEGEAVHDQSLANPDNGQTSCRFGAGFELFFDRDDLPLWEGGCSSSHKQLEECATPSLETEIGLHVQL